ncbi:MAG: hypothetical protein NTX79_03210 [Candidatus Micrarchaeota archaeon]|nr:hypothetical protein [Candidatus Micrarchaeota archaeon]
MNNKLIPFGNPAKGYTLAQTIYLGTRFRLPSIDQLKEGESPIRSNELLCLTPPYKSILEANAADKGKYHVSIDKKTGEIYRVEMPQSILWQNGKELEISYFDIGKGMKPAIRLERLPDGRPTFEIHKDGKMGYIIHVNDPSKWFLRKLPTRLEYVKSNWMGLIASDEFHLISSEELRQAITRTRKPYTTIGGGTHFCLEDTYNTVIHEPSEQLGISRVQEDPETFLKALNANAAPAIGLVDGVLNKALVAPLKNLVEAALRMDALSEKSRVSIYSLDVLLNESFASSLRNFVDAADAMRLLAEKTAPVLGKASAILDKEVVSAINQLIELEKQMTAFAVKAENSLNAIYGIVDDRVVAPLWDLVNAVKGQ